MSATRRSCRPGRRGRPCRSCQPELRVPEPSAARSARPPSSTMSASSQSGRRSSRKRGRSRTRSEGSTAGTLIGERIWETRRAGRGQETGALDSRELGGSGYARGAGQLGEPARRADHRGLRLVRRHDVARPYTTALSSGRQFELPLPRDAIRPEHDRGVHDHSGGPDRLAHAPEPALMRPQEGREGAVGGPLRSCSMSSSELAIRACTGQPALSQYILYDLARVLLFRCQGDVRCKTTPTGR